MKYFAEFYAFDLAGSLARACGDRALIHLDGRMRTYNLHAVAADTCKARGYVGYVILRGDSLRDAIAATTLYRVDHLTDLQTFSGITA